MSAAPVIPAIAVRSRALLAFTVAAGLLAAGGSAEGATARVQYVSATSIYLDAGRASGLSEGAAVTVVRDGREVARLVVDYVAMNSAVCRPDSATATVRVGDLCRFTPVTPPGGSGGTPADAVAGGASPAPPAGSTGASSWTRRAPVRGQIVTQYLRSTDVAGGLATPAVAANFDWAGPGQQRISMRFRGSRPTYDARTDLAGLSVHDENLRLYEAQVGYRSRTGSVEAEAGRLAPRRLEFLGSMDGVAARARLAPALSFGVAGGRAASLGVSGFGTTGARGGAYLEASARPSAGRIPWSAFVGAAFLGDTTLTRRQYLVGQAQVSPTRGWTVRQTVEVDLNPAWKQDLGEEPVVLTAWAIVTSARVAQRGSITAGVDSRRGVLLPEQRAFPGTAALDRYEGAQASGGWNLGAGNALRVGGGYRHRVGGGATYRYVGAGWSNGRLARNRVDAGANASVYRTDLGEGLNADLRAGARWSRWSRFEISGGWSALRSMIEGLPAPASTPWIRTGIDYRASNGVWAALAHEWRSGSGRELAVELGVAF